MKLLAIILMSGSMQLDSALRSVRHDLMLADSLVSTLNMKELSDYQKSQAYQLKGYILGKSNKINKATDAYVKSVYYAKKSKDNLQEVSCRMGLGQYLRKQKLFEKALLQYSYCLDLINTQRKKLIGKDLDTLETYLPRLHYNIGLAHRHSQNFLYAIDYFAKAQALGYEKLAYYQLYGNCYRENGQLEKALDHFKQILKHPKSNKAFTNFNIARTLVDQDKHKESIAYFEESLKIRPNDFNALLEMGEAYLVIGEIDKAKECLDKCKENYQNQPLTFDNLKLYYLLAKVYPNEGHDDVFFAESKKLDELKNDAEIAVSKLDHEVSLTYAKYEMDEAPFHVSAKTKVTAIWVLSIFCFLLLLRLARIRWIRNKVLEEAKSS